VYAETLAREHGPQVAEIMFEKEHDPNAVVRRSAVRMLGTLYEKGRGLSRAQKDRILATARGALAPSNEVGMRVAGINVLGRIGSAEDIPVLREISRKDLISAKGRMGPVYPVRMAADDAIARIAARAKP
jgi:hypothetical protein